jgi:NAD(P)H-dependent flavin oxidoreductase YrpB (nitropropane dioxygenase family)
LKHICIGAYVDYLIVIGEARAIRAAASLGADFAYMGTRCIATRESMVSDEIARC